MNIAPYLVDCIEDARKSYRNSIYSSLFNASDKDWLDITHLKANDSSFAPSWVRQLLDSPALGIELNPDEEKKVNRLYISYKNHSRERGGNILGFGYPFLAIPALDSPNNFVFAPLFIWDFNLIPSRGKAGNWQFQHNHETAVRPNYFLIDIIEKEYNISIKKDCEHLVREGQINSGNLLILLNELALKLGMDGSISSVNVREIPQRDKILEAMFPEPEPIPEPEPEPEPELPKDSTETEEGNEETEEEATELKAEPEEKPAPEPPKPKGQIYWSGVLGIFPPQQNNVLAGLQSLKGKTFPNAPVIQPRKHPFSCLLLDPAQQHFLRSIGNGREILLQGASGTGKTYTLAALVSNALGNGHKCLVVSSRVATLDEIKKHLTGMWLGDLSVVLKNVYEDVKSVIESVNYKANALKKIPEVNEERYQIVLQKCERQEKEQGEGFQALNTTLFNGQTWTELVGEYLHVHSFRGKELLAAYLDSKVYDFTEDNYKTWREVVSNCETLYGKVGTLKHPLRHLHSDVFSNPDPSDSSIQLKERLESYTSQAGLLEEQLSDVQREYSETLLDHYNQYYDELKDKIAKVREEIVDNGTQFGKNYKRQNFIENTKRKLYSNFSYKYKNISSARKNSLNTYHALVKDFNEKQYFEYKFSVHSGDMEKVLQNINDFEISLDNWHPRIPQMIRDDRRHLSGQTVHPALPVFKSRIDALEKGYEQLLREINEGGTYEQPIQKTVPTLQQKEEHLEELQEKLEYTTYNMRGFEDFYYWQRYWQILDDPSRKIVLAMIRTKASYWPEIFDGWFLFHRLNLDFKTSLPHTSASVDDLTEHYGELNSLIAQKALKAWSLRQGEAIKRLKREYKTLYTSYFGIKNKVLPNGVVFKDMMEKDMTFFTEMFPVVLTTPDVLNESLPQLNGFFDYVIFDDATEVPLSKAIAGLAMGQRKIICGNRIMDDEHSLFHFALLNNFENKHLNYQHIFSPVHQFNHRAFAPEVSTIPTASPKAVNMVLKEINGRYNETTRVNKTEADKIISYLLNDMEPKIDRSLPKTAVICFTYEQRNYIYEQFLKIKIDRSEGYNRLVVLEQNDFKILHIDELYGDRFETTILSTTFGLNENGIISKDLKTFLDGLTENTVNMLTSRTAKEVIIYTSIPESHIENEVVRIYETNARPSALLMYYLCYAEAVQLGDDSMQKDILNRIDYEYGQEKTAEGHSVFVENVAASLLPYFEKGRIETNVEQENCIIDIVVKPQYEGEPPVAIICDGHQRRESFPSATWEKQKQKQIELLGYKCLKTWSVNWWKNPDQQARKLASLVIKQDSHYQSDNLEEEQERS